jgi:hypothetical protein
MDRVSRVAIAALINNTRAARANPKPTIVCTTGFTTRAPKICCALTPLNSAMVFTGGRFAGACALLGLSYSMGSANTDGTIVATGTYSEMHQQLLTLGNGYMIRKYTHTGGLKGGYSLVQNDFRATNQEGVVLGDAPVSAQEIFGALVVNPIAQTEHEYWGFGFACAVPVWVSSRQL